MACSIECGNPLLTSGRARSEPSHDRRSVICILNPMPGRLRPGYARDNADVTTTDGIAAGRCPGVCGCPTRCALAAVADASNLDAMWMRAPCSLMCGAANVPILKHRFEYSSRVPRKSNKAGTYFRHRQA